MAKNTDLHTHSHYSDGQLSPTQLVRLAKKRGVMNLALTDHNSVRGVSEAIRAGKKFGVNVIPGVEIEVETGEILGYFIDTKNKPLRKLLRENRKKSESRVLDWCNRLRKAGYPITLTELKKNFSKARENLNGFYVLYTLYKKGYGKPLKLVPKLKKNPAINPKHVKYPSALKAIKVIKKAGGVPVLPHPWIDDYEWNFMNIDKYVRAGLRGIEMNNGDRAPLKSREFVNEIKDIAKEFDLILTSGSDYHGKELVKLMPGNHELGKNNCDSSVVEQLRKFSKN